MNTDRCACPVRPFICPLTAPAVGIDDGWERPGDSHFVPDHADAQREKMEDIIDVDDDVICQPCTPMPAPAVPTAAQIAAHNITHLPYRSWCPYCVAARRPNTSHGRSGAEDQKSVPMLVADYCFMKDFDDEDALLFWSTDYIRRKQSSPLCALPRALMSKLLLV